MDHERLLGRLRGQRESERTRALAARLHERLERRVRRCSGALELELERRARRLERRQALARGRELALGLERVGDGRIGPGRLLFMISKDCCNLNTNSGRRRRGHGRRERPTPRRSRAQRG